MIEARELNKRYGDTTAVHSLSFTIAPGTVTGFLGPNTAWTWPRRPAAATGRSPLTAPEPWRTRVTHVGPQTEPGYLERDKQDEFN